MTRSLCAGERRANSVAFSAAVASSASDIFSTSAPSSMGSAVESHVPQTLRLIELVVPGQDLDGDAVPVQRPRARPAVALGGSRNAT